MPEEAGDAGVLDTAAVMAALQGGSDEPESAPDPTVDPAPEAEAVQEVEQTPTAEPLGPDPDVSDLDPAVAALVNQRVLELRQGFTRRTTELADANRILEAAGGDPEAVLEAYTFQQMLMDDGPEGVEARDRLYQALNAQRGTQSPAVEAPLPATPEDPFAEYDLPPEIRDALSMVPQLNARLQAFESGQEAHAQELAHQQYVQEVADDLVARLGEITTEYPDLADAEDDIVDLGYSTQGNLLAAVDKYRAIEARIMSRLFDGAVNVPGGQVSPPTGGGHSSEPPEEYTDIKSLRGPVTEYLERVYSEIE